jgi:trimethylamine--corrinoid protein Co-methyltransferase
MIPTVRPKVELLSAALVRSIIDEGLSVLEKQGVFIENDEALTLLQEAGMRVERQARRAFLAPSLVEKCLAATPSQITLFDRKGAWPREVGGDSVHFDPGSAAVKILDGRDNVERPAVTADVVDFVRLTDGLDNLHFQSTGLVSSDVPDIIADSYRLYIGLLFSSKPVVTGTFKVAGFQPMLEMLEAVRGGAEALRSKPLAIFDACPSPPLKWSHLTTQSLIDSARAGIPSELISMGMTGATSPVTLAGTLVQHVAENLAGLVICQLARPGAPVIFGGSPSSFDMRKGTTPMGAIETMMIDVAYTQIAKSLHLPSHAYMSLSDAKVNDSQAGLETALGAVLAGLAGVNVVSGPGMLNFESCQSLEKLVIDNETCGMVYRLLNGVSQREEPMAANLLEAVIQGGSFLTLPHTRQWFRKEHVYPRVADRDTYDAWVAAGRKTMTDRAHDEAGRLLSAREPDLPAPEVVRELRKIMQAEASRNGVSRLPDIPGLA